MKNSIKITAIVIGALAIVLIIFYEQFSGNKFSYERTEQLTQLEIAPNLVTSEFKSQHSSVSLNQNFSLEYAAQPPVDSTNTAKMDYDSDWCIAAKDLNQEDIAYFEQELNDWNISRGRISTPLQFGDEYVHLYNSSQLTAPYMEVSYDAIWQQIQVGNIFAMIAALGRDDFDRDNKRKIAVRLVVQGHTSKPLKYLITVELVKAKMLYEDTNLITPDIEEHLYRALAYTAYGIKYVDLDAAFTYLRIINSSEFPLKLNPIHALGKNNRIDEYTLALENYIYKMRTEENITLAFPMDEPPKAARHYFDSRLASLYREFGVALNGLKVILPETTGAMLEASECVQKQVQFINDLERGRKARQRVH
ncbi:hypothetical protein ACO1PK_03620 [Alishewanella sp. d11]|uniref:hypothetical protein n=1 Tax=Alishewanella sp. d11 TaxID=3414030 RepID=UPI003BF8F09A